MSDIEFVLSALMTLIIYFLICFIAIAHISTLESNTKNHRLEKVQECRCSKKD